MRFSASRWTVRKNLIADFAKAGGDGVSYGAFFKGAGEGNVFEQNVVRCEWRHHGGIRIGFSFGGGGTAQRFCRNNSCTNEHYDGVARSNRSDEHTSELPSRMRLSYAVFC